MGVLLHSVAQAQGCPLALVGGLVRDTFLDKPSALDDWDVIVPHGQSLPFAHALAKASQRKVIVLDEALGIARVVISSARLLAVLQHTSPLLYRQCDLSHSLPDVFTVDVAPTLLGETPAAQGSTEASTPWEALQGDLGRRDFTINAMVMILTPWPGAPAQSNLPQLLDPFGGGQDLAQGRLHQVAASNFLSDPLRVVRAYRFLATLPSPQPPTLSPDTTTALKTAAPFMPKVAGERLWQEWQKLLEGRWAVEAFASMLTDGTLLPCVGLQAEGLSQESATPLRLCLAQWQAIATLEHAQENHLDGAVLGLSLWGGLRLACLVQALYTVDETLPNILAARWHWGREGQKLVAFLDKPFPGTETLSTQYDWLITLQQYPGLAIAMASLPCIDDATVFWDRVQHVEGLFAKLLAPPLLESTDVMALTGLPPSEALGQCLAALKKAQVLGEVSSRETAIAWLRQDGMAHAGAKPNPHQ